MPSNLIPHVDKTRLDALQMRLETMSLLSRDFLILLACSTIIATLGLFQNSAAVIIGAMIIAPLMRPLVGLSLSTLTADSKLLMRALLTLFVGTLMPIAISAFMAQALRSLELTAEILGRTHPTLLDLGVAMAAGAIGAYCQANEKLVDSLAGVAIAVALVPPLSVVGIGFAFNSVPIWTGAALLYATNLVGITFAGALVFLVMGFTPLTQAKKGLALSALIATFLVVPLGFSMRELILENQISASVKTLLKEKTVTFKGLQLHDVHVRRFRTPMSVVATVFSSDETISSHQVKLVQDFLSKEMGAPVEFRLRIIPSTELSAEEVMTESQAGTIGNPLDRGVKIVSPASEASAHSTDVPAVGPAVTAGSDDHGPTGSSGSPDDGLRGGSSRSPGVGPTGSFGSPDAGMAGSAESPDGGSKGSSGSPSAGGASSTQINAGDYNTPAEVMRSPNEQHVKEPATMPVR